MTLLANYWRVVRGFDRNIWLFLSSSALLAFAYLGVMGVLFNLFLLRLGYGPRFIGLLTGSGQLLWAALALPAAAVGLRIGPRSSMAVGYTLIAAGAALIILVQRIPSGLWSAWLVGSWMLLWTGAALNTVNSVPYLMNLSRPEERDYAFAAQSSALALFAFVGSLVGGYLPSRYAQWFDLSLESPAAYGLSMWIAPVAFLLAAAAILQVRPVTLPRRDSASGFAQQRPTAILLFVTLTIFLIAAVEGSLRSFFNVYLDTGLGLLPSHIGVIMGVGQLLPAAAALTAPVLMGSLGPGRTFSLTALAAGLFMVPMAFIAHWAAAAVSFVGIIGAVATSMPARNVFSQVCVGPEWRSSASAATTIGMGLGWAAMAALGGFIIEIWGFTALFLLAAGMALLDALLLALYLRRWRKRRPVTLVPG